MPVTRTQLLAALVLLIAYFRSLSVSTQTALLEYMARMDQQAPPAKVDSMWYLVGAVTLLGMLLHRVPMPSRRTTPNITQSDISSEAQRAVRRKTPRIVDFIRHLIGLSVTNARRHTDRKSLENLQRHIDTLEQKSLANGSTITNLRTRLNIEKRRTSHLKHSVNQLSKHLLLGPTSS